MKTFFTLLFNFFIVITINAQNSLFQKESLSAILIRAKQNSLPVMILLDAPTIKKDEIQRRRNILLNNIEVKRRYQKFLCYRAICGSKESVRLRKQYKTQQLPVFLFLNSNGEEVYRSIGFLDNADKYIEMANTVITKIETGSNLVAYTSRYQAGERSREFLYAYIKERIRSANYTNSDLIEEYVQMLTIKEIATYEEMRFILEAGPIVGSKTHLLTYIDRALRDSIYKSMPFKLAVAINNRTIDNSFNKAIADKDLKLAQQAGNFLSSTYGKEFNKGYKAYT